MVSEVDARSMYLDLMKRCLIGTIYADYEVSIVDMNHGLKKKLFGAALERMGMQVVREFDLILFDHSLEHIADQIGTLKIVRRLLTRDGVCIVRIPIAASDVWKEYDVDWVELDAPRHYFIHTPASFRTRRQACRPRSLSSRI